MFVHKLYIYINIYVLIHSLYCSSLVAQSLTEFWSQCHYLKRYINQLPHVDINNLDDEIIIFQIKNRFNIIEFKFLDLRKISE